MVSPIYYFIYLYVYLTIYYILKIMTDKKKWKPVIKEALNLILCK